ncbi:MAG: NYN domain-containing protein [Anaerolineae bacterium]|nr:NYN domain-containing protein [Anaerolineae bacterium]
MEETNRRLALMIDGDNAQAALLPEMLAELSKYGILTIRRVYGDWTEPEMKSWKEVLHTYALQPVQQFRYTVRKNATDSALIIDAMDILYTAGVDGFCIASSDSDYTRLATRIREKNLFVLGIGRQNTARAFVNACDVFVYTENLQSLEDAGVHTEVTASIAIPESVNETAAEDAADFTRLEGLFRTAFELAVQDDGWAHLGAVGSFLRQLDPAFDPRTYRHKQLSQLVEANSSFIETQKRKSKSGNADIYIRLK